MTSNTKTQDITEVEMGFLRVLAIIFVLELLAILSALILRANLLGNLWLLFLH